MIENSEKRLELQLKKWIEQDSWAPVRSFVRTGGYNGIAQGAATVVSPLAPGRRDPSGCGEDITAKTEIFASQSVIMIGKAMFDYIDSLMPLAVPSLARSIGQSLQSFIGKVFEGYDAAIGKVTEEKGLAIVLDSIVFVEYIVPKIVARMDHALECTVGETRLLLGFSQTQNEALLHKFGKLMASLYVNSTVGWNGTNYTEIAKGAEGEVKAPRNVFNDVVDQSQSLIRKLADAAPSSPYITVLTKTIIEEFIAELERERNGFWINVATQGISRPGLHQLTLDLKYFAHLCEKFMSKQANDLIKAMLKRAKKNRKKGGSGDSQEPDPSDEWYDRAIRANTTRDKIFSNFINNLN